MKLKVISLKILIFKAKINTTHVALNALRPEVEEMQQIFVLQDLGYMYGIVKKTQQFICMPYYVAPETPMMSPVITDCPDLAPPYFGQVYATVGRDSQVARAEGRATPHEPPPSPKAE